MYFKVGKCVLQRYVFPLFRHVQLVSVSTHSSPHLLSFPFCGFSSIESYFDIGEYIYLTSHFICKIFLNCSPFSIILLK